MSFPSQSTSLETAAIKRALRVLNRAAISDDIAYAGVFVCKKIAGSNSWSQHAYGNAADLFPKASKPTQKTLRDIADAVVRQATKATVANRGVRIKVAEVIDHDAGRIWTPMEGWHSYGGTTGAHIHVSGSPLRSGTPACA
jgi:hypothetical protein